MESEKKSHTFEKTTFNKPTWCKHCNKFLIGVWKQGYYCYACKIAVHDDPLCIQGAQEYLDCTMFKRKPSFNSVFTMLRGGNSASNSAVVENVVKKPVTNIDELSVLMVNISGPDSEGIAATFFQVLADYNAMILDIGQAVIHHHLEMGILFHISGEDNAGCLMKDLLFKAFEYGLQVSFTPVSGNEYKSWVAEHGKPRHTLTIVGRRITAGYIARISKVASDAGLNIDRITRLSGRPVLHALDDEEESSMKACVTLSVRGNCDQEELKKNLFTISHETGIDIAFQKDTIFLRNHRLVAFDMDSTLIQMEVIDELAKRAGVGNKVSEITARAMRGEIDWNKSFEERLALLKGLNENVLEDIAANMPLTEGLEHLIKILKKLGFKLAIISGGFEYFANHLKKKLGFDYVYSNKLEIINGKVTGRVSGQLVNAQRKAEVLKEIAQMEGISLDQTIAVGDGANDLLMLSTAGLGVAFHAKPIVREKAKHAISSVGLDGLLYLIGISDRDIEMENFE